MPNDKYIRLTIGDKQAAYSKADDVAIGITYQLEDTEDFQRKSGATALNVNLPATPENDGVANTFHDVSIEDLTDGEVFRKSQPFIIEANGDELLIGKVFLESATHTDLPESYEYSFYGNNSDWALDLKETTLFDVLKHISFTYSKQIVKDSWQFNGLNESLPYVFAPARYKDPFAGYGIRQSDDQLVPVEDYVLLSYLKPSLSIYWILFWAFKSIGYRIESDFFNTDYFRRMVMPWVWGNFLTTEGTKYDVHKFRAKANDKTYYAGYYGDNVYQLGISNVVNDSTEGMFDNNNDYIFDNAAQEMKWTYNTPHYGVLQAHFSMMVNYRLICGNNCHANVKVVWYKNGVFVSEERFAHLQASYVTIANEQSADNVELFFDTSVSAGDVVSAKIFFNTFESKTGSAQVEYQVLQFQLDYFKIPYGGTISFDSYLTLKKVKVLDLLRGVIDCFNLTPQTNPATKTLYIEPIHPYSLTKDLSNKQGGYFNGDFIDWEDKQDISKVSTVNLFKEYERDVVMKFRDDNSDGALKKLQDRHQIKLAASKYIFPERFKAGKKEIENRFFAPTIHYDVEQFKDITGVAPQMIVIVPENISNTSASEAENTFTPKICYYKGIVNGMGWRHDGGTGIIPLQTDTNFPYMFSVNYKLGGENDPILSYSDENISNALGIGLFKRFFLKRFAIMRNGQWYDTWFKLNNNDVQNYLHREHKILKGQKWECVKIDNYLPTEDETTKTFLRKSVEPSEKDSTACYPTFDSVVLGAVDTSDSFDVKYYPLKALLTDITVS